MFEDPTIQNEQIIERLRQICLQNTQGQIDNIFIGKQYFCSYDNLYDESKCTELYARLEDLRMMYGRWCSNLGHGDQSFHQFNFKEMLSRFNRWRTFKNSNQSYWEDIILRDNLTPFQSSNFEVPKTLKVITPGGAMVSYNPDTHSKIKNMKSIERQTINVNDFLMRSLSPNDEKMNSLAYSKLKKISNFCFRRPIPKKIAKPVIEPVISGVKEGGLRKLRLNGQIKIHQKAIFTPFRIRF